MGKCVHYAWVWTGLRGGSRIFFRRGCTRLLLYFNTNKPHSFFFCRIPVVLENRRSSRGGGVHTPCTLPLDPPLGLQFTSCCCCFLFLAFLPFFFGWSDLGLKCSTNKEKLTTIELDSINLLLPLLWLKSKLHLLLRSLLRNAWTKWS